MTEELSPEFLKFSEMLDQEDAGDFSAEQAVDAELFLDLREALREPLGSQLPGDFAAQTAKAAIERFHHDGPFSGWKLSLSNLLFSKIEGYRRILSSVGLSALVALGSIWHPTLLLATAVLALASSLSASFLLDWRADGIGRKWLDLKAQAFERASLVLPALSIFIAMFALGHQAANVSKLPGSQPGYTYAAGLLGVPLALWTCRHLFTLLVGSRHRTWISLAIQTVAALLLESTLKSMSEPFDRELLVFSLVAGLAVAAFPVISSVGNQVAIRSIKSLFYALPSLAGVFTAMFVGTSIFSIGMLSYSLRDQTGILALVSVGVVMSTFFLIVNAAHPYWEAQLAESKRSPIKSLLFQLFHLAWSVGIVHMLMTVTGASESGYSTNPRSLIPISVFLASIAVLSWRIAVSRQVEFTPKFTLSQARKRAAQSFCLGLIPILATGALLYQMSLTREIYDPSYIQIKEDAATWVKERQSIAHDQNGWLLIRPYLIKPESEAKGHAKINKELKILSGFIQDSPNDYETLVKTGRREDFESKRAAFIQHLPLLQKALNKPEFSFIAVEGNSMSSMIPDLIAFRGVSQGFQLLYLEAFAQNNPEQALEYAKFGLRWGTTLENNTLIMLMIRVAQLRITVRPLEDNVIAGDFTKEQLGELSRTLREALPQARDFSDTMKRDTALLDSAFDTILKEGRSSGFFSDDFSNWYLEVLPESYWQSERKAYWNNQLARCYTWWNLALPNNAAWSEISPFNVASEMLIPNSWRAQAQFCALHSKMSALILECELERYHTDHGSYPETLEQLVPDYLEELPEDYMQPQALGHKGGFLYQTTADGYLLISRSHAYEKINEKIEQVYGHTENLKNRSPKKNQ